MKPDPPLQRSPIALTPLQFQIRKAKGVAIASASDLEGDRPPRKIRST